MRRLLATLSLAALIFPLAAGCSSGGEGSRPSAPMRRADAANTAHDKYLSSINANDADAFLAMITDDAIFMPPGSPRLVGKAEVGPWASAYLDAYRIHWDKTVIEFVVSGRWAYEIYAYHSTDTPRAGGDPTTDTGKGIIIYRLESDGAWRVARDAWNSDLPPAN